MIGNQAGVVRDFRFLFSAHTVIENLGGSMPLKSKPTGPDDKFDVLTVNAVLKGVVREKPAGYRYVNPHGTVARPGDEISCYYSNLDDKPSCLVGQVIYRLGLPLPEFGTSGNYSPADDLTVILDEFTPEAVSRLVKVQSRQDQGETWARAIR